MNIRQSAWYGSMSWHLLRVGRQRSSNTRDPAQLCAAFLQEKLCESYVVLFLLRCVVPLAWFLEECNHKTARLKLCINQGRVYLVARDNTSVMLGSVFKVPWQQRSSGTSATGPGCSVPCGRVWSMIHCLMHWEHKIWFWSAVCAFQNSLNGEIHHYSQLGREGQEMMIIASHPWFQHKHWGRSRRRGNCSSILERSERFKRCSLGQRFNILVMKVHVCMGIWCHSGVLNFFMMSLRFNKEAFMSRTRSDDSCETLGSTNWHRWEGQVSV